MIVALPGLQQFNMMALSHSLLSISQQVFLFPNLWPIKIILLILYRANQVDEAEQLAICRKPTAHLQETNCPSKGNQLAIFRKPTGHLQETNWPSAGNQLAI